MDRLTYKYDDKWCISGLNGKLISDKHANYWGEAIDRLATYENTELHPEAFKQCSKMLRGINILQFYEWLKAYNEERLVILPCKVGDSYFTYSWGCHGSHDDCLEIDDCDKCHHLVKDIRECKFKNAVHILDAEKEFGKTIFLTREEAEIASNI